MLPELGPRGLRVVAVLGDAMVNDMLAQLETVLSFPVVMDADLSAQDQFGSPVPIYPRNVILDREGRIVHADNFAGMVEVQRVIEAELAR